jgi:predicted DNA-binding WGR domain protein
MTEWRRFERGSRTGAEDQFWAVRLRGRVRELRYGYIDGPQPTEERREYPRESAARSAINQAIRSRLRRGWVEVEELDPARLESLSRAEPLECAIARDPSRLDHWAVYADFLQGVEPLLGERLALGLGLGLAESNGEREKLRMEIDQLEQRCARELLGATLAGALGQYRFEDVIGLDRQFGMIVGARIHDRSGDVVKYDALVRALLELPLARVLVDFHVYSHVDTFVHLRAAQHLLARRRPTIQRLTLGTAERSRTTYELPMLVIQALLDQLPALERLELHGSLVGAATHAGLRELKLGGGEYGDRPCKLIDFRLPSLETLHWLGPDRIDWPRVELPRLERLLIARVDDYGDRVLESLARAPWLAQLHSLVLVDSDLSVRGIQTLLDHAEAFAQIERVVILDAFADPEAAARLRARLPNVLVGVDETREDPLGMYAPSPAEHDELTRFW